MRSMVRLDRPRRDLAPAAALPRPVAVPRRPQRTDVAVPRRDAVGEPSRPEPWAEFQPDPCVDYGRFLTPAGGILIAFKDLDLRFRHLLWRWLAWTVVTGAEAFYLLHEPPLHALWLDVACLLAVAVINWLIVRQPVEVYRSLEIRPDCIIIDGAEVFWTRFMDSCGLMFQPDPEGNQVLCGIYGTRFVEYLTIRRFDACDRTPEVFAAHLNEATTQLWSQPQ